MPYGKNLKKEGKKVFGSGEKALTCKRLDLRQLFTIVLNHLPCKIERGPCIFGDPVLSLIWGRLLNNFHQEMKKCGTLYVLDVW